MIINNYNTSNSGIDIEIKLVKDVLEADYRVRAAESGHNDDFALGLYADNGGDTRLIVFYADQAEKKHLTSPKQRYAALSATCWRKWLKTFLAMATTTKTSKTSLMAC